MRDNRLKDIEWRVSVGFDNIRGLTWANPNIHEVAMIARADTLRMFGLFTNRSRPSRARR